jgi:D-sedoheptulose 7-phosphate isomerase
MESPLSNIVSEACRTLQTLNAQAAAFDRIAAATIATLKAGGKVLTCGNGGSAADALHLAEELVGRYTRTRRPLPAVCLNADPTLLTCIGNDFGFDEVFARQVEGLAGQSDLFICFSSSGHSANIVKALETARRRGVKSVALLGKDGGAAKGKADCELIVASNGTARVQEAHTLLLHALLDAVEAALQAGKL